MWAVEQMKQGKKVRRFIADKEEVYGLDSTRNFVIQSVLNKNKFNRVGMSMVEYEATDWEVVEEPKKTLHQKLDFHIEVDYYYNPDDVKESLKDFIDSLNQLKGSYVYKKAKEIFGEELIGE